MTVPDLDGYRARVRAWLESHLEPRTGQHPAGGLDPGREFAPETVTVQRRLQRRLFEAGYAGLTWPAEYGGQGLDSAYERVFEEEARRFLLPDFGLAGKTSFGVCAPTMLAHASPEFLRRHIPAMLAGDEIFVEFFSEPEAGSDLAGVRTRAERDSGGRWHLNGSKIWSSGAYYADYGMCLARTDWDAPKHRGLTWFAVPTRAEGVTVRRIRQITGDADFCEEFFDDVELTDDDVIGPLNGGWAVTQTMLFYERGGGAGTSGRAKKRRTAIAPDLAALAAEAGRSGDPLVRDLIARAHVDDLVCDALGTRLGALMRADPAAAASLASYGKLAAGTFEPIRAGLAMRIGGDAALTWDGNDGPGASAAAGLLNGRFMAIAGGTNEMQRNTIGERVLGLPREPAFDTRKPFADVLRDARTWDGRVG